MLISNLPCPEATTPFCAEDVRVFMMCDCPTTQNPNPPEIEIPAVISASFNPNVQSATKSRYYGTGGQFVAGCAGRREVSLAVRAKWCLTEPFDEEGLHGKCACFRVVPDPSKPDEFIRLRGVINLDVPQVYDNNSTDEVEWGFTVEGLEPEDFSTMPQGQLQLNCGATAPPVQGGNVIGGWTAQDTAPTAPGEFKITQGGLQLSTTNAAGGDNTQAVLALNQGDIVYIVGDNGNIALTLTAPPAIQGGVATLTGTEAVTGTRPVAGESLIVELAPYEAPTFGADLGAWVAQSGAPSGNGELQLSASDVKLHATNNGGTDWTAVLTDIAAGDKLMVIGQTGHATITASGAATESSSVFTVAGTIEETGVPPTASDGVVVRLVKMTPATLGRYNVVNDRPANDGEFQIVDADRWKIDETNADGSDQASVINALATGDKVYVIGPVGYMIMTLTADAVDAAGKVTTLDGTVTTVGVAPVVGDSVTVRHK